MSFTFKTNEKKIKKGFSKTGGRNNQGKITHHHHGGGHKKKYIKVYCKNNIEGGIVKAIKYDPNRTAPIALIQQKNHQYYYVLAPSNLKIGDTINPLNIKQTGTSHKLQNLNIGTYIYNIELKPNQGGKLIKSAGTYGQIIQKQKKYSKIKLPSGEQRLILNTCFANIGKVANNIFKNIKLKKAGNKRWLGKRPKVRGVAMNPVDHPHGGGEGKTSGGRHPVSPWGKLTKGKKTVKKKNKYIILKRTKKQK